MFPYCLIPLLQKGLLPKYFSSAWSHAQFRLPPGAGGPGGGASASAAAAPAPAASATAPAPRSVVAFGAEPHTLLVAVTDGTFHRCVAPPFICFPCADRLMPSQRRCSAALRSTPPRPASAPAPNSRASSTPRASLKPATPQPPRWTRCRSRHLPRPPQPPQTHDPMKRQLKK